MSSAKYIGMDVHKETISLAVMNNAGKLLMESVIETKASTILQFFAGLRGDLRVTFEEGTWAAWLYDLLQAHVTEIVVCNPRKNALLNEGNKSDRIDARKLADLLRGNYLKPVYHGEHGLRMLKELVDPNLGVLCMNISSGIRIEACASTSTNSDLASWLTKAMNREDAGWRFLSIRLAPRFA